MISASVSWRVMSSNEDRGEALNASQVHLFSMFGRRAALQPALNRFEAVDMGR